MTRSRSFFAILVLAFVLRLAWAIAVPVQPALGPVTRIFAHRSPPVGLNSRCPVSIGRQSPRILTELSGIPGPNDQFSEAHNGFLGGGLRG